MAFPVRARLMALAASAAIGGGVGIAAQHLARPPIAAAALGTDDVFARGLHERELPNPLRWTTERAVVRFCDLPPGPASITVEVHGQRDWVSVVASGKPVGTIAPGVRERGFAVAVPGDGRLEIELRVRPFVAGDGRSLGAQLGRVAVDEIGPRPWRPRLVGVFAMPAAAAAGALMAAGVGPALAVLASLVVLAAQWCLLVPWGVLWSDYATTLACGLVIGAAVCAVLARLAERSWRGAARWAAPAGLAAVLVQGAAATWPAMIASDVAMNAHNLRKVSAGNWWLESETQHQPTFKFPYGPAFYAPMVPFERAGVDPVQTVRAGAAVAGLVGSVGLFWLLAPRSPVWAAAAVVMLQLLPGTFDRYSYGNLSNIFAQSATVWFFAWWARGGAAGPFLGAAALLLAALGHFSSLLVLCVLLPVLLVARRGWGDLRRSGRIAVVVAGMLVLGYYATFLPLILKQLPRLLEGAGAHAHVRSTADVLRKQGWEIFWEWGLPAIAMAWAGRPRSRKGLDADLLAFWGAGGLLAVAALVSPVEARYLYALTLPLAVAAGQGAVVLARGGVAGRVSLALLLAAQLGLAVADWRHDLYFQYRG